MRIYLTVFLAVSSLTFGQAVTVSIGPSTQLNPNDVKVLLGQGSAMIKVNGGSSCGLSLSLAGNTVGTDPDIPSITLPTEFDTLCQVNGIHVVGLINSCSQDDLPQYIEGCGRKDCAIVAWKGIGSLGQSLWMHEYAHTKCITPPHRSGKKLLMNPSLNPDQFQVSDKECTQIKTGCKSDQKFNEQVENVLPAKTVEEFVQRHYIHGLPFAQAELYSTQDMKKVSRWLQGCRDSVCKVCEEEQCWLNIVMLLGLRGSPNVESAQILRTFLQRPPNASPDTRRARLAVPLAIGYLMHRIPAAETDLKNSIREFLKSGTQFQTWEADHLKTATNIFDRNSAIELAKQSILGLGVSGTPEADQILQQLLKCSDPQNPNNTPNDGCDEFLGKTSTRNLINYGIKLNTRQQLRQPQEK